MWNCKPNFIIILLICHIQYGSSSSRIDPLVDTGVGLIRGLRATDGDYAMFMGIPYATVNQSNPFGPSISYPKFEDTFEAYDDSAICPQVEEFNNSIVGTLDCLHINVYVPSTANSRNKLPVLVWIYGGGFSIGFSGRFIYGPKYLVREDVILVTFNYRLGPYGFMCLDTPDIPGNQGLKDQSLALKWIKSNIDAFGGDSNKITLFGESAGGASVDFHLLYDQEKVFDKVIMQSGVGLSPWSISKPDPSAPLKLAEKLGFPTSDTNEALNFLTASDPKLVIAATTELHIAFGPCVENKFDGVENFIYDYPVNIKNLNLRNVNILLGFNSDESLYMYEILSEQYSNSNVFYEFLENNFDLDNDNFVEMEAGLRHFYIGDEIPSEEVKQDLIKFSSDINFNYPTVRTINKYLNYDVRNIYHYMFSYDGGRNFVKDRLNTTAAGATHADELGYLFDISYMNKNPSAKDQLIIDCMSTMWTNFVKYGNPTPDVTELLPVQWPAVTKELLYYLNINSELDVQKRSFNSRIAFWELFYKINEKYQLGYQASNEKV